MKHLLTNYRKSIISFLLLFLFSFSALAQTKVLKGIIKDQHSGESVPFASVQFQKSGIGKLADSSGTFLLQFITWPKDTLFITSVGFQDYKIYIEPSIAKNDTINLIAELEPGRYNMGVVVTKKVNRGLRMWKQIVKHKPENDRARYNNYSYELYNKLELDFKNVNKEKLAEFKLLKPFSFVLNNIDTSEGASFLPIYLTEALSEYYQQKSPVKRREVFKAVKTLGMKNESVSKLLGGMDQNVNFYSNFIPVFDKQFVSPISDNGDNYYNYKVADTQYVAGRRLIHFFFTPKRRGENTFEGDCWVHDTTYAIQKMNLRLGKEANVNFVEKLSLIQEYRMINDSTWFLSKDKFVADITPFGKSRIAFIGKKTTTYQNVVVDDSSVLQELAKNKIMEEVVMPEQVVDQTEEYWAKSRHEDLNDNERAIYHMIDTIQKMPQFKRYQAAVYFLTVGYKDIGNLEIGPWYNWISYNQLEGYRLRFDLGTNTKFSKQLYLHGYLAYGFNDNKYKYKLDGTYLFNKSPRAQLTLSYAKDIDYGQSYYDAISQDNIFALAVRKSGIPIKFLMVDEKRIDYYQQWKSSFGITLSGLHKSYDPLLNLPPKSIFLNGGKADAIATSEISLRVRYAFLEKFLESTFNRISLGSPYPIVDVKYTKGLAGIFNSNYNYSKINGSISDNLKVAPYGNIYYNIFGGRTFGKLPYMLLDIAPGNEIYYYNKYAFNLMNRYEFLHDRYTGINVEHNIGNGIFRIIPGLRKLKLRQFYSAKALWGNLSSSNRQFNMPLNSDYKFESLNGNTYLEVGTGVDNILKVLRVDFVWRVLPRPLPVEAVKRFGIFGSFRFAF